MFICFFHTCYDMFVNIYTLTITTHHGVRGDERRLMILQMLNGGSKKSSGGVDTNLIAGLVFGFTVFAIGILSGCNKS
jgi:hypothetical protein